MERFFREYEKLLKAVRENTYGESKEEAEILINFLNNWIDLISKEKWIFESEIHSLSGLIFLSSFRLTSWIGYEILCGEYFEALRDLRFIFEGSVYGIIYADAIEEKVYKQWGMTSEIGLKKEILNLLEKCRKEQIYQKKKINKGKIETIVNKFFSQKGIRPLDKKIKKQYINTYIKILSDKRLYLPMSGMLRESKKFLNLKDKDINELSQVWHELSKYSHFSYPYLDFLLENPDFLFKEIFNKKFFIKIIDLYSKTLDFFYSVFTWRFGGIKEIEENISKIIEWWGDNYSESFPLPLTQKVFKYIKRKKC